MNLQEIEISEFLKDIRPSVAILEGGLGLSEELFEIVEYCRNNKLTHWVLDELYSIPRRIISIGYLQPDLILFETTGASRENLKNLIEYFKITEYIPKYIGILNGEKVPEIVSILEYCKSKQEDLLTLKII